MFDKVCGISVFVSDIALSKPTVSTQRFGRWLFTHLPLVVQIANTDIEIEIGLANFCKEGSNPPQPVDAYCRLCLLCYVV